jgi:hypothetical protein
MGGSSLVLVLSPAHEPLATLLAYQRSRWGFEAEWEAPLAGYLQQQPAMLCRFVPSSTTEVHHTTGQPTVLCMYDTPA